MSREEGHVEALEQQLASLEANKEQLEKKLHTVYASLRTVTRMYQDQAPASPIFRGRKSKVGEFLYPLIKIRFWGEIICSRRSILEINLTNKNWRKKL